MSALLQGQSAVSLQVLPLVTDAAAQASVAVPAPSLRHWWLLLQVQEHWHARRGEAASTASPAVATATQSSQHHQGPRQQLASMPAVGVTWTAVETVAAAMAPTQNQAHVGMAP